MQSKSFDFTIDRFRNKNYNIVQICELLKGGDNVFDYSELVKLIVFKYDTHEKFAEALGIGRVALSQKLNNRVCFTQREINDAAKLLGIKKSDIPRYFFAQKVQKSELI